jgi:Tol biopolymer transport system component
MTTGGLCGPVWSPDGKTFLAAGVRGLFAFTEPQYEARVLMMTSAPAPPASAAATPPAAATPSTGTPPATVKTTEAAPIPFSQTAWSPGGRRVAFLLTTDGVGKVRVVDAKDGSVVFTRDQSAKLVLWGPDDRTLVIDGVRVSLPS